MTLKPKLKSGTHSAKELAEYLRYEPETGKIFVSRPRQGVTLGTQVGTVRKTNGYGQTRFSGKNYYLHRLAWILYYGSWPKLDLDHINADRMDNRIKNLRQVTRSQNSQNQKAHRSGQPVGVRLYAEGRWKATAPTCYLNYRGPSKHLGYFPTSRVARAAVMAFCKDPPK